MAIYNVGRVKGSMIYSGLKTTSAEIKLEVPGALDGDMYISQVGAYILWIYDGTTWNSKMNLKGPQGVQGIPGQTGPKGDTGAQGPKGDTGSTGPVGAAAGFGTCTATVGAGVGTPSVNVTAGGPNTAKTFAFDFQNLKGVQGPIGPTGSAAGFGTPTAVVDANVGIPSVTITPSGPDTAKIFAFSFKNLKGVQGVQGIPGPPGPKGDTPVVTATLNNKGELVIEVN